MAVEVNFTSVEVNLKERNKSLYKLFLLLLKYIPILIVIAYILNTLLCYTNIEIPVLSNIAGLSLFTWVFMYISSYVFNFCLYQRLLLYYILVDDLISIFYFYFIEDIYIQEVTMLHTGLIGILMIALVINHVRNNKATTAKDSKRH